VRADPRLERVGLRAGQAAGPDRRLDAVDDRGLVGVAHLRRRDAQMPREVADERVADGGGLVSKRRPADAGDRRHRRSDRNHAPRASAHTASRGSGSWSHYATSGRLWQSL